MEEIKSANLLFNGLLETGVRTTVLLNAAYPNIFDIETLTLLDYLVVHTSEIDGLESLHPRLPYQTGEILVRRQKVENSLVAMCQLGLVTIIHQEDGVFYQSTDDAYPFVNLLKSTYSTQLKKRANWLAEYISKLNKSEINKLVNEKLNQWNTDL